MKIFLVIVALCFLSFSINAQIEVSEDALLTRIIQLADGKFHKLEIKSDGVYLDEKIKGELQGSVAISIIETPEYWEYPELGFYYIVGIEMATGMCGIPTYAAIYVDANGNVRVSKASPSVCIGDYPFLIEFRLDTSNDAFPNGAPIWKLSSTLEFNGLTFIWKELPKPVKSKIIRKKKN